MKHTFDFQKITAQVVYIYFKCGILIYILCSLRLFCFSVSSNLIAHPEISGDRKQKRAKCWLTLTQHELCFVFGTIKVVSIIIKTEKNTNK